MFRNSPSRANGSPSFITNSLMLPFIFSIFFEGRHPGDCSDKFYKKTQEISNYPSCCTIGLFQIHESGSATGQKGAPALIIPKMLWRWDRHVPVPLRGGVLPGRSTGSPCRWSRTETAGRPPPSCGPMWCYSCNPKWPETDWLRCYNSMWPTCPHVLLHAVKGCSFTALSLGGGPWSMHSVHHTCISTGGCEEKERLVIMSTSLGMNAICGLHAKPLMITCERKHCRRCSLYLLRILEVEWVEVFWSSGYHGVRLSFHDNHYGCVVSG